MLTGWTPTDGARVVARRSGSGVPHSGNDHHLGGQRTVVQRNTRVDEAVERNVVGFDEHGMFNGERTDVPVNVPLVQALAYSKRFDRLYVAIDEEAKK